MKRVLVTGGNGFLGRHVVERLRLSSEYAVFPVGHSLYDLLLPAEVEMMYMELQPDIVVHLAASCGGIGANQKRPADFFYDNLMMGMNMIHYAPAKVEKFVQIGSVCSYPITGEIPFTENQLWNGYPESTNAPYGVAKRALWTMCDAYRRQYGLNAIYLMPVNLYGPGDNFDSETSHAIPALIRKFIEAKNCKAPSVTLWGTGRATREFLYAADCAEAIVLAIEKYNKPEPVNIATGEEISIFRLASIIAEMVEFKGLIGFDPSKPDGQPRRLFDTKKATEAFGFKASTSLIYGLRKTINWYAEQRCGRSH